LVAGIGAAQQKPPQPNYAVAQPMPTDREEASYAIYSKLLPGNQIEWGDAARTQWLLEDTTVAVPLEGVCASGGPMVGSMNPHQSVKPPQERQAEFAEVLADYDAHCHDRYQLDPSKFHLSLPIRMLDEEARKRYVNGVMHYMPPANDIMRAPATPDEFKGAAGLHSFTAVYFNRTHTLAMTEIGMYCGGLCGMWRWVVLEKKNDQWHALPWVFGYTIS
jgi:hypothetical protein